MSGLEHVPFSNSLGNHDPDELIFFRGGRNWHPKKDILWVFNIAMENDPFIDDFPIKTTIYSGFSMAMLNNQMVGGVPPKDEDG